MTRWRRLLAAIGRRAALVAAAAGVAAAPPAAPTGAPPAGPAPAPAPTPSDPPPVAPTILRVISFNIRYENRNDGANAWNARRHAAIRFLADSEADFIGLQEVLPSQRKHLVEGLPGWGSIGRSREASAAEGESTPIFYRRQRWSLLDGRSGTFWLSETPTVAGSRDWKSGDPRIATWGVFRDRSTGRLVFVLNTHLDHQSQEARERGAQVIARFVAREAEGLPVVVMGDFNAGPVNPARRLLIEGFDGSPPLRDTYALHRSDDERAAGTFHGFKGGTEGLRIDAILVSAALGVQDADIVHTDEGSIHLSDHYPVTATLRLESAPGAPPGGSAPPGGAAPPGGSAPPGDAAPKPDRSPGTPSPSSAPGPER